MGRKAKMLVLTGRDQLRKTKPVRTAFTAAKQRRFFEALRQTCNVLRSCEMAEVSTCTVYRYRKLQAAFRAQWAEVLREAYADLELAMLDRALNGTARTVTRDGAVREVVHDYPNAVALTLLRLHRDAATEAAGAQGPIDVEELRERLAQRIERLRERHARDESSETE